MNARPLNGYVIIDPQDPPEKTKSGIYLAERERWKVAKLIEVSRASKLGAVCGDWVVFHPYTGVPVPGEDGWLLVREEDLVAVLEDFDPTNWEPELA